MPVPFKKRYAGKHAAQMKLLTPTGGTLEFEGPMSKALCEFVAMAVATDGRHTTDFKDRLVAMTEEMKKL